jgi:hypothetical protein
MNSKERRFWRRFPGGLKEILAGLPRATKESFEAFGRTWRARIQCTGRRFTVISTEHDLGYMGATEIIGTGRPEDFAESCPRTTR